MTTTGAPRLTSAQVAARLNVKLETLYAYVSRGLLAGVRSEEGGSTFDPLDVEAFAAQRSRRGGVGSAGARAFGRPIMVLDSDLAMLENDELYFRGVPARQLARRLSFEQAVEFLWRPAAQVDGPGATGATSAASFVSGRDVVSAVRRAARSLGPGAHLVDRLSLAVTVCGSWQANRDDRDAASVQAAGRRMIATMVDALDTPSAVDGLDTLDGLGGLGDRSRVAASQPPSPPPALRAARLRSAPIAERLWAKLSAGPPTAAELRLLNAALVLCLEHDLAISTMGARVAASARVNPYSAVAAALCSFDSTVHGAASIAAAEMIAETMRTGNAERALGAQLAQTGSIAGFGHLVYRHEDPRAAFLLQTMRGLGRFDEVIRAVDRLGAVVEMRSPRPINLDLALGALVIGAGLRRDAGELIFAVGRTAGWIAHIVDEYTQPTLRLRPEARYTGPSPNTEPSR